MFSHLRSIPLTPSESPAPTGHPDASPGQRPGLPHPTNHKRQRCVPIGTPRIAPLITLALLAITLSLPPTAWSQSPTNSPDQTQRQQRLLTTTSNIAEDVTTLTREFQRNGLGGDDVSVLEAIGTVLGSVSADGMPAIIANLTKADDDNGRPRHLMAAYGGQKTVAIQLREVVLAYGRQVEIHELARRVRELGDRQSLNLHETVALTFAERKTNASRRQEEFQVTTQLIKSEQASLRDEVENLNSRFSQLAVASMTSLENRAASASSFIAASGVNADLNTATDEVVSRRPMSSTSYQRDSRDSLWQLANIIVSDRAPLEQLIASIETLDRIIAGQSSVVATISSLTDPEENTDQNDNLIQIIDITEKRIETLQKSQGHLTDRTSFLTATLRTQTPAVIPFLEAATPPMQNSRLAFNQDETVAFRRDTARPLAGDALRRLEQARELLLVAIEEFELTGEVPVDRLDDLRQLLEQTRELKAQQQNLSLKTASPDALLEDSALDQAAITQRTEALERAAAAPSPEAARDIGEAAGHMQTSADALQKSENLPATQQAAVDALTRAEQTLEEQIATLEEAAEQLAALEEIREDLTGLIADQQDLQQETTNDVADPNTDKSPELAEAQNELKKQSYELAQRAQQEDAVADVPQNLNRAAVDMEEAISQLENDAPAEAQPEQAEALEKLGDALNALDEQIAALNQELGTTPPSPEADATNDAIAKAQENVADALSELSPQADAIAELAERQQAVADALASEATADAQDSAQQASDQLASGDLPEAAQSMQQTQDALADAAGAPPGVAEEQAAIQALTEQLAAQNAAAALDPLNAASDAIAPLTSGQMGALPAPVGNALADAQAQLAESAAEAAQNNAPASEASAQAAQTSLAEAAAAMSLAQAGLAMSPQPGEGDLPGEGKLPGKGEAKGKGQLPGKGKGEPPPKGTGDDGNWNGQGGADGPRRNQTGSSNFIGLPDRKRGSLNQSRTNRFPAEYGDAIEKYFRDLSEAASDESN